MDAAAEFAWAANFVAEEWRVVLYNQQFNELAWSEPLQEPSYRASGRFQAALAKGGDFYWCAIADCGDHQVKSELVRIRVP